MAHAPNPTVVICKPLDPSGRVGKPMMALPQVENECRYGVAQRFAHTSVNAIGAMFQSDGFEQPREIAIDREGQCR
jgi:hypothetical protein